MHQVALQRLLYIEDDDGLAELLRRRLERHQFQVTIAATAEEGLAQMQETAFDVVLLDYNLPGMSGLEFLDVLPKGERTPPIILLTAGGDESVAVAALEKGAADYAVKDTGQSYFDLLPAVIHAAVTRENLQRENALQQQELRKAKEKAEAANSAKTNFLATMSHEIRTPLNVVIGLANILSKSALDAQQAKIVDTLETNANILLRLINDLLDVNRIEGGHVKLEAAPFSMSELLKQMHHMFADAAAGKSLQLILDNQLSIDRFIGDQTRIQQILMNLVGNALKFTEKGEVRITTCDAGKTDTAERIEISVSDTGIGIDASQQASIFDKFTQADETITRRYGGSGLGLSIAFALSRLMHGELRVESTPGKGSIFRVVIELQRDMQAAAQPVECDTHVVEAFVGASSSDILLVEDYAPNIMVATMMLEDMGYQVTSVENGSAAITTVESREKPFRAILMDVQMHGMDGLETTRRIRALEEQKPFKHTIIGVTAHALAGDRERCLRAGMSDYMSKPIHPDILAEKLRKLA